MNQIEFQYYMQLIKQKPKGFMVPTKEQYLWNLMKYEQKCMFGDSKWIGSFGRKRNKKLKSKEPKQKHNL